MGGGRVHLLLSVLLLLALVANGGVPLNRSSFGKGFVFGTASASYQYEGAYNVDGRGPSIWDTFTHQHPEKIANGSNGDIAVDQYHRYKEDVALMKDMGLDAYRFSISWSRVLPYGKLSRGVNEKGIQYYNNLINELLKKGLQPYVTLFHWDASQGLEDEYGGFLSARIVSDFQDYAELCFKEFGDRVKHWITLNEPWTFTNQGYDLGVFAPGRCSSYVGNCSAGNSATEPYIVGHNLILAHASAVKVYREKFQAQQKGEIGVTLVSHWMIPFSQNKVNTNAAQRALDFMLGWYLDPITFGDYPKSMKALVKNRLPKFTKNELKMVKGSYDFLGVNYYTANYAAKRPQSNDLKPSYGTDSQANLTTERNGIPIGKSTASSWLYVYPQGFRDLLVYIKENYKNPPIYITENGVGNRNDNTQRSMMEALNDTIRVDYYNQHLEVLHKAINENHVDVKGYFAWSLLDNFEWADGYTIGFGICYVDPKTLRRHPKKSFNWFKKFLLH